jgi:hypothetical protein
MATLEAVTNELEEQNHGQLMLLDAMEPIDGSNQMLMRQMENQDPTSLLVSISNTLLRIESSILGFMDIVPESMQSAVDGGISDLIREDRTQDKIESREVDETDEDDEGGFFSPYTKAKENADKSLAELIGGIGPIVGIMGFLGNAMGILSAAILPALPLILGVALAITAFVAGVMTALDYFNDKEGSFGEKILAGIEGFFQGAISVITKPLDWLKDMLSGFLKDILGESNIFSEFLDSFSYFETMRSILSVVFDAIGDLVDSLVAFWEIIKPGIDWVMEKVDAFKLPDWLVGSDDPSTVASEVEKLSQQEFNDGKKAAKDSGLYEKNTVGFTGDIDSVVDESKLASATPEQLRAIIADDDLSDDQMFMVKNALDKKTQTGIHAPAEGRRPDDPRGPELTAEQIELGNTVYPPMSAEEAAAAVERAKTSVDPIGTVKDAAAVERAKTSVDPIATVKTALERDPVTGLPLAGSFKAPEGSEGSTFTVFDPMSGQVETFDNFEKASMFADTYGQEVKTVPKASVAGSGISVAASQVMSNETNRMNAGRAELSQRNRGGSVAVNAPSTSNTVNNQSIHSGSMGPSYDRSDNSRSRQRTGYR